MVLWKRKITALGLAAGLLVTGALPGFAGSYLYEEKSSQPIGSGVEYQHLLKFGSSGWLNLNVVTMDLKNPNTKVDVVHSANGVSTRDTLSGMMSQVQNPLAAINADYFYLTTPDSPLGVMVQDGKMVSSTVLVKPYNVLSVTNDGQAFFGPWQNNMNLTSDKGASVPVSAYNKVTWHYAMVTILDKNWGANTPGAAADYSDLVEMVVRNGVVAEIRQGQPSTAIPQDGYVVLASGERGQFLLQTIHQGDQMTFSPADFGGIRMAVGGGSMLIQNGTLVPLCEPINGAHPRSAVGVTADGNRLMIATVDGRHPSYTGLDGSQMASLMKELGCYNAMILDSGGSTTMLVKELGNKGMTLENVPSDGPQRKIINGLVIASTAPKTDLGGITFKNTQDSAFSNQPLALSVTGYDSNYQALDIDPAQVTYTVLEGKGRVEGQRLIPTGGGSIVVEAAYQGKTVQKTFKGLAQVAAVQLELSNYRLIPGGTTTVKVMAIDKNGYRAALAADSVQVTDDKGLGSYANGVYTAGSQEGSTILRANCNGLRAAAPLAVGLQKNPAGAFEKYGFAFAGYPQEVTGSVAVVPGGKVNPNAAQLNFDLTGSTATTAAYLTFANGGIPLSARPQKIGVWVNAQAQAPHWVRAQMTDAAGKAYTLEFQQGIDWTGWKYLTADVPQTMTVPARLEKLYVVETDPSYKTKGTLLFDGLDFQYPAALPAIPAAEQGGVVKDPYNQKPAKYDTKWLIYGGSSQANQQKQLLNALGSGYEMALLTGVVDAKTLKQSSKTMMGTFQGYNVAEQKNGLLVFLNNSKDGLRKTDYNQWPWLKNILAGTTQKTVYVFLPKPIWGSGGFSDTLEANLLGDQLTALAQRGTKVYVFYGGGNTGGEIRNGVWYIGTGKEQPQYISLYKLGNDTYYSFDRLK